MQRTKCGVINQSYNNTRFYNCPCIYFYCDLYLFMQFPIVVQCPFLSTHKTLQHFFQGRSEVMNSLSLFIWECLKFSFTFEGRFCQTQVDRFFFGGGGFVCFSTLNISAHCLLASQVSDQKSVDYIIEDPLYVMSDFFLAVLKICCLSVV